MSAGVRHAQRALGSVEGAVRAAVRPLRNFGFPYRKPTVPRGVEVPPEPPTLGADYDTSWARTSVARAARGAIIEGPLRMLVRGIA
ncbi:MAG TPA: hypothetical protein VGK49_08395, partial [Ilumatobacteraceae bacterium]